DAPLRDDGQDPLHLRDEIRCVAACRVARFLFLQDGHRDFGEVIHHQVVDGATCHLTIRRFEPISPKPLPACDPDRCRTRGHRRLPPPPPPPPLPDPPTPALRTPATDPA